MGRLVLAVLLVLTAVSAEAGERHWLGKARIFTNDRLGDGRDRWRSGAYAVSAIRGTGWTGGAPESLGELVEYRLRAEIIAPADLSNPVIGTDRRYVGALHFGAFSHVQRAGAEMAFGLDLVVTGPQTRLGVFQSWMHERLGLGANQVLGSQIGNAIYPTLSLEIGRDFNLARSGAAGRSVLRPFVEAQAGVETFARIGADMTFGPGGDGDLLVRDTTTGHRSTAIKGKRPRGLTYVVGGDVAYVADSAYLPRSSGFVLTPLRTRLRAGVLVEERNATLFYGLTWMGKEFTNQTSGQVVGSMTLRLHF